MMWILSLFVLVIGLCIGSFLNVVILRTLSGESIVFPASKCPKCQHKLYWWHNIPVLSYIFLRGKCGFCGEKISIQYPIIEILTGLLFVLCFWKYGISLSTLFAWIIASLLMVLAGTDWKEKVVFDVHTYSLIGVGLFYATFTTGLSIWHYYSLFGDFSFFTANWALHNPMTVSLLGIILGFVVMELVSRAGYLLAGTRAFGEGDSYIAAGLGAVFGWNTLINVLILSVVVQILVILPMFIKKEFEKKNYKTLAFLAAFIIYAAGFYTLQAFGYLQNMIIYTICTVILAIIGLFLCREILKGVKDNPDDRTYLPYGPALVVAGMIALLI